MQYSVVIPIYNDAYLARACCEEVARVFTAMGAAPLHQNMELLFINDGSKNDSLVVLKEIAREFDFVKVIDLSRNFGQHQALACGFREAKGELVVRMNVDMQDPPAEIPKMLEAMKTGDHDMVIGQYAVRKSPLTTQFSAWCYYSLFKFMTGLEVQQRTSPLRIMNRRFIDAYNALTEKTRFPQGLDKWLGFRQLYVEIEHRERADKKSSYNFFSRLNLALTGLLYFSDRPIKIMTWFGFAVAVIGLLLGLNIVVSQLFDGDYLPGYASLAAIGLITFGIQILCLGLIGLYIGKIFREVQGRPLYIVREVYGQGQ